MTMGQGQGWTQGNDAGAASDRSSQRPPLVRAGARDGLRGVVTHAVVERQEIADRGLRLANALHRQAIELIEQKGADMTVAEAQRVVRLFLLRSMLLGDTDIRELSAVGKDIGQIFPPAKAMTGNIQVEV